MYRRTFLAGAGQLTTAATGSLCGLFASRVFAQVNEESGQPAAGPLRVPVKNPRYFSDTSDREILLVGSHT